MRIYFSGLGGVAIGPLALIARDMGHEVLGSEVSPNRQSEAIAQLGIIVSSDQSGQALRTAHQQKPIDWFIYTAALKADNPELTTARELGIRLSKRDELLNELIKDKRLKLIAVSGTHGKTTTTGMLIWLFKQLGLPVSYSVGTSLSFGDNGQFDPASQYFVYEADEYDRNFLHFTPYVSIIPSVDYDHPDTYPSRDDYLAAFGEFVANSHCSYLWRKDAETIGIHAPECVHTYGADADTTVIKLAGEHNRRNAYLVVQALHELMPEHKIDKLYQLINAFPGTERRFEKLGENLYTDYAHHPSEISATIQLAKELNKKVVVVYQPHQNVRQHTIRADYRDSFNGAERVYWLPTYLSREDDGLEILTPAELIKGLANPGLAEPAEMNDDLKEKLDEHLSRGELIVLMSAGDLDSWARRSWVKT